MNIACDTKMAATAGSETADRRASMRTTSSLGFTGSVWDLSEQRRATEEADKATRYARLVQDVAEIANSATTMREALQRSLDVICESMGFPGGHALLINDDEPELAKSAHIVYIKDRSDSPSSI